MGWRAVGVGITSMWLLGLCGWNVAIGGEGTRFAMTHSRSEYVHWIELYDANDKRIDPTDPDAAPYSPVHTCGRCHDYEAIAHGYHFNAMLEEAKHGRRGEPWLWTDDRTGTHIPLSYRSWAGTYNPRDLGISAWDMVLKFGRHMPGGGPGEPSNTAANSQDKVVSARELEKQSAKSDAAGPAAPLDNGRWNLSGELAIDCMMCHAREGTYSPEKWWDEVSKQNFAWAPAAALGIADIDGDVSRLKDVPAESEAEPKATDGDPPASKTEPDGPDLPKTHYRPVRMDNEQKVFFDVVQKPSDDACYYCHTTRMVGEGVKPDWTHDQDVHLRAGMSCTDCHRHGIGHHVVRGYEGEDHPTGVKVVTLSCRGCHLGEQPEARIPAGRLGAPKALHKGLPPLHLEDLSCTACHSGPPPSPRAWQVQTAMAHGLGLPTHHMEAFTQPQMVAPVMLRTGEAEDVLYPHRMVWPAFWGEMKGETVTPLNPETVYTTLRRTVRVRRGSTFTETMGNVRLSTKQKIEVLGEERGMVPAFELTDEEKEMLEEYKKSTAAESFREKLGEALAELQSIIETEDAEPVYVAGGQGYRLSTDQAPQNKAEDDEAVTVEVFETEAAEPYAWKLAHDVRPANWSTGYAGCYDCHSVDAPIFEGEVTARGPAIEPDPPTAKMVDLAGYDTQQMDAWNLSFQGRAAFKWFGFACAGVVAVILMSFGFLGVIGILRGFRQS
ncbi:MAG: hypothetical protein ACQESR_22500 [Planctomycetota bacterium]